MNRNHICQFLFKKEFAHIERVVVYWLIATDDAFWCAKVNTSCNFSIKVALRSKTLKGVKSINSCKYTYKPAQKVYFLYFKHNLSTTQTKFRVICPNKAKYRVRNWLKTNLPAHLPSCEPKYTLWSAAGALKLAANTVAAVFPSDAQSVRGNIAKLLNLHPWFGCYNNHHRTCSDKLHVDGRINITSGQGQ